MTDSTINNTGALIVPDGTEMTAVETVGGVTGHSSLQSIADLGAGGAPIVTVIANDTDITVAPFNGTTVVLYTAITAPRIVTFPPAAGLSQIVIVKDVNGQATNTNLINLNGSGGDTVAGPSQIGQSFEPDGIGQQRTYTNNGVDEWDEVSDIGPVLNTLFSQLGGTDADGNVYRWIYDPGPPSKFSIKCVTPDGVVSSAFVIPGQASISAVSPGDPGSPEGNISVQPGQTSMFASGDGYTHNLAIDSTGFLFDGVTVDPTLPWPGG